jgi:peroxiredoxin family protein
LKKKMSILLFSGEYDKALAALLLANTARTMDIDTSIFFAFWGLCLVRDPEKLKLSDKSLYEKMFGIMTPKGPEDLPLSKMNFAGIGKLMLKEMMEDDDTPPLTAFLKAAINKDVKLYGCKLSMEIMGLTQEEMLPDLQIKEAKDYLADALESDLQLFI